ncbi:MAG: glycosyltransferase N-terminal domain-containing protein [Opitutae bacterium]|jgi:3-deoxy-D-manno-octulosonic-acid transferase|nr:glycosyltransferase N-terminal domain-containing protein [Opitutae bacterium]MDG1301638.1 glycosyltransferase N-terminal domain-containing protein [Opitutae bacterium]
MIWFYRLLYLPTLLVVLPYYGWRMWRRGGYAKDFQHRLGRFRRLSPPAPNKKRIWLQAVSVGEILAIGPLIQALQADDTVEIVLTTTTSTGYAEAKKCYKDHVYSIGVFPLDFWLFSRLAWQRIQPDVIIMTESELWPEHLYRARINRIPTFLINARISDRSFKRYQKIPGFAKRLLQKLDCIFAASDLDQARLIELGAKADTTLSTGSIKFDVTLGTPFDQVAHTTLCEELGFGYQAEQEPPFILLGSSTWPGEEAALLRIQASLIATGFDCRLLLVPRHAERAPEITRLLNQQPLIWHQRSQNTATPNRVNIQLADTTGELARLTQVADLAFIGKSLEPNTGGQTPIEAAGIGIPIVMGPNMTNFKAVAKSLVQSGAALSAIDENHLKALVLDLAKDSMARTAMSQAGRDWHGNNKGSSARIAQSILAALN